MTEQVREYLIKEFEFYLEHQAEMVEKFDGRVIVLKEGKVIGDYDSYGEAVEATRKEHPLGTFLVQRVSEGRKDYTQSFSSRVRFP